MFGRTVVKKKMGGKLLIAGDVFMADCRADGA